MNDITKPEPTEVAVSRAPMTVPDDFLLQIVRDGSIDAAKLQVAADVFIQLQDKQRQWAREQDAEEARRAYLVAKAQAQAEYPIVPRTTPNPATGKAYSTLDTVWRVACPVWTKHGFSVSFNAEDTPSGLIDVSCIVSHERGHREVFTAPAAASDDKGIKGNVNKTQVQGNQATITFIQRGLLCRAMGIVTAEEDDDGNSGRRMVGARDRASAGMITLDQAEQIRELVEKVKPDIEAFCKYYHVRDMDHVEDMAQEAAQHAIRALTDKLRAQTTPESTAKTEPKPAPTKAPRKAAQTAPAEVQEPVEQKAPEPEPPAEPPALFGFEAFLLDEYGEPIRDDSFTDVVQFTRALIALWEKSPNREALMEQNADGIADAMKVPAAATILRGMEEAPPVKPESKARVGDIPDGDYKSKGYDPDEPIATFDPDRAEFNKWVATLNQHTKTPEEVDTLARNPALGTLAARWRSEGKATLIAELQKAFLDRKAELRVGA